MQVPAPYVNLRSGLLKASYRPWMGFDRLPVRQLLVFRNQEVRNTLHFFWSENFEFWQLLFRKGCFVNFGRADPRR